jgi:hypothetical protein
MIAHIGAYSAYASPPITSLGGIGAAARSVFITY